MELKVGDKVRIKSNLKGTNRKVGLAAVMEKYASKEATVIAAWHFDEQTPVVTLNVCRLCMWEYNSFVDKEWD